MGRRLMLLQSTRAYVRTSGTSQSNISQSLPSPKVIGPLTHPIWAKASPIASITGARHLGNRQFS